MSLIYTRENSADEDAARLQTEGHWYHYTLQQTGTQNNAPSQRTRHGRDQSGLHRDVPGPRAADHDYFYGDMTHTYDRRRD